MLNESLPLEHYGHNLSTLAKCGVFSPLTDQDPVVNRVFEVLQRKSKNLPVILASDEVRRWKIVAEVIRRMALGIAPASLLSWQVIGLDYEALFSNLSDDDTLLRQERIKQQFAPCIEKLAQAKTKVEEEQALLEALFYHPALEEWIAPTMVLERLQSIFIALRKAADPSVLYVNHFHRLAGGEPERYPIYAQNLLKPALNRDQVRLIGACTLEQYRQHIERDASIQRRCQEICLPETSDNPK